MCGKRQIALRADFPRFVSLIVHICLRLIGGTYIFIPTRKVPRFLLSFPPSLHSELVTQCWAALFCPEWREKSHFLLIDTLFMYWRNIQGWGLSVYSTFLPEVNGDWWPLQGVACFSAWCQLGLASETYSTYMFFSQLLECTSRQKRAPAEGLVLDIDWRLPEPIALNMLHASVLVINQLSPTWGPSERDQTGTQHHSLQEDKGQFDDREDGTKVVFLQLLKKQSYWYLRESPLHQSPRYCNWPPLFLGGCVRLLFVGVCWASISLATSRANCPELRRSSQKTSVRKPEMVSL